MELGSGGRSRLLSVALASQASDSSALAVAPRQALPDRPAESRMRPQLQECIETGVDERLNSGLEHHWIPHVAPPVVSRKLASRHGAAGDRRDHWNRGRQGDELLKAAAQFRFERIHLSA